MQLALLSKSKGSVLCMLKHSERRKNFLKWIKKNVIEGKKEFKEKGT